jgi:uncharacterized protein (DUF3820 family)
MEDTPMRRSDMTVVPFGKYKGHSVEELIADTGYLEWLSAQTWFRERYVGLYQIIINRGVEPQDSPEHNALQVLFLDDEFCLRFAEVIDPGGAGKARDSIEKERQERLAAANKGLQGAPNTYSSYRHNREEITELLPKLASTETEAVVVRRVFEHQGIDVIICVVVRHKECPGLMDRTWLHATIELKPTVGDDYPSVLRQMIANRSEVLMLDRYTGEGATREQFVKTFQASGKRVVFLSEIRG